MAFKIPLAWFQLTREKIRLLVALAGIGFANILMFVQLGFQDALFDSATRPHRSLEGDIFLVSPQSTALIAMKSFSRRRLIQALSFEGVESVTPLYLDFALWKSLPDTTKPLKEQAEQKGVTRGILIFGFDPADQVFNLPEVNQNIDQIKKPDVVLYDQDSRGEFGPVANQFNQGKVVSTEVGSRKITVGGLFKLGPSFGASGNLITSDLNFRRLFSKREPGLIDVGIIKIKPGVNVPLLVEKIRQDFPKDVLVKSREEFIDFEKSYWQKNSSIGFIFGLGTAMGFIVGIIIVYQILYTDVSDHLAEYATLKAMGYTQWYLLGVVFQEAIILASLGYIPGISIAMFMYNGTKKATNLPIAMTSDRAIFVLILTFIMCFVSGAIAVRKLKAADPADIF